MGTNGTRYVLRQIERVARAQCAAASDSLVVLRVQLRDAEFAQLESLPRLLLLLKRKTNTSGSAEIEHAQNKAAFDLLKLSAKSKPFVMVWLQIHVNRTPFHQSTCQIQAKNETNSEGSSGETKTEVSDSRSDSVNLTLPKNVKSHIKTREKRVCASGKPALAASLHVWDVILS